MDIPELVKQYVEYCNYAQKFNSTGIIDLQSLSFVFPTTLLPLGNLIFQNPSAKYLKPVNSSVSKYVSTITSSGKSNAGKSYVPIVTLPQDIKQSDQALKSVYNIQQNDPTLVGGEDAFKYVVNELVDNIYQHSKFTNALIMAQKYQHLGYVDLCFFDNGITIPQSFINRGMNFKPYEAIAEAINGISTVNTDRGFGLRTSIRIFLDGLKGQILVVSGAGAVYFEGSNRNLYSCTANTSLKGTLIGIRVPYPSNPIDIYDYVE